MNEVYLSINKVSKILGVTPQTLRNWDKSGYFKPEQTRNNGYRYYSQTQIDNFIEKRSKDKYKNRINVGYCRVSTTKQKEDLKRQADNLNLYLKSLNQSYQIIKDIGSGINYNKKGLKELITLICKHKVDTVYVLSKDRLVRFGFELIEYFAELNDCRIVVLDNEDKSKEQELVEDLMQIITIFSCRLHGQRASKTRQLMQDLVNINEDKNE